MTVWYYSLMSAGDGTPVGNIVQILLGLAKSYFNIKGKSNTNIQVGLRLY